MIRESSQPIQVTHDYIIFTHRRQVEMIFHGSEMIAVKWRNFKAHFSIRETARGNVTWPGQTGVLANEVKPNVPLLFDVGNDPKELWNIGVSNTWVLGVLAPYPVRYAASVKKHPNLEPGAAGPK